jgi:hypothetical protein
MLDLAGHSELLVIGRIDNIIYGLECRTNTIASLLQFKRTDGIIPVVQLESMHCLLRGSTFRRTLARPGRGS